MGCWKQIAQVGAPLAAPDHAQHTTVGMVWHKNQGDSPNRPYDGCYNTLNEKGRGKQRSYVGDLLEKTGSVASER